MLETKVINYGKEVYGCSTVPVSWAYHFRDTLDQYVRYRKGEHILPREEPLREKGIQTIGMQTPEGAVTDVYHVLGCTIISVLEHITVSEQGDYNILITG